MSKMFDKVTCSPWNPLGGDCIHSCVYCWAKKLAKKHKMAKYVGAPRLIAKEFNRKFKDGDFVFVQDMSDLFADNVPWQCIQRVLYYIKQFSNTTFLLLTKNPKRYLQFKPIILKNFVCGVTIESDLCYHRHTDAPLPWDRAKHMEKLTVYGIRTMVSIEPIMDFSDRFHLEIKKLTPEFVYVGYDNYNHKLPEPPLNKTEHLIKELNNFTTVHVKTLRKAWNEK